MNDEVRVPTLAELRMGAAKIAHVTGEEPSYLVVPLHLFDAIPVEEGGTYCGYEVVVIDDSTIPGFILCRQEELDKIVKRAGGVRNGGADTSGQSDCDGNKQDRQA